MLGNLFGHFLDKPLSSMAKKIPFAPNTITAAGFILTILASFILSQSLFWGGVMILFSGLFDMLDGIVARTNNKSTQFGAFIDSVLDRYSDSFLFLGLAWYFFNAESISGSSLSLVTSESITGVSLSIMTMIGALLVSYTRARAEGLGKECKVGLMERPERILLMAFGALTGWILPVMWIMLVLTHLTVLHRIYHVWKSMEKR
ncbi:MAG: CDP-alcohol phosphatidyltransferase family protein [Nitrospirota bacterium]